MENAQTPNIQDVVANATGRSGVCFFKITRLNTSSNHIEHIIGDIGVEVVVDQDADPPVIGSIADILEQVVTDVIIGCSAAIGIVVELQPRCR